jgi:hypothetical protein
VGSEKAQCGATDALPFLRLPSEFPVRSLEEVVAVGRFLTGFPRPWWVGGGWSIDLWAGGQSREHEDIEICVLRSDQGTARAYCAGWQPFTPVNERWAPLAGDEWLEAPRSMLQLQRAPETVMTVEGMPPTFEFILNDVADSQWIYTGEPSIRVPLDRVVVHSPLGLRVTAPEVLLLHKACSHRPKDEHDFRRVRDRLGADQRAWLKRQIARIRPDDPWLPQLG